MIARTAAKSAAKTPTFQLKTEDDFKAIPGLRWRRDADGTVIATTVRKRLRHDHLYFHGPNRLGVYYERSTHKGALRAVAWYAARLAHVVAEQPGDCDGTIVFACERRADIPSVFLKSSLRGRAGERRAAVGRKIASQAVG